MRVRARLSLRMLKPLIVFLGSGLGGTARYLLGMAIGQWLRIPFPAGTVTIVDATLHRC